MDEGARKKIGVYIFWAVVIGLFVLAALIVRPYIIPLISAFILAYLTKPIYNRIVKIMPPWCAAFLCILIVILIILVPIGLVTTSLLQQASTTLQDINIHQTLSEISQHPFLKQWNIDIALLRERSISLLISWVTQAISSIPAFLIGMLIIVFSMFYMLTKWDSLASTLTKYIPFKNKERTAKEIDKTTRKIVYGTILTAIIEWIVAALGFYISGVETYILLATIIFLFAFIPGLGPAIVWAPIALIYLSKQNYLVALGVFITGMIISFGIELVLRTKLIGESSSIHPLVMLLGILGGISLFGIFGFIIGPLILAYALKLVEESIKDK